MLRIKIRAVTTRMMKELKEGFFSLEMKDASELLKNIHKNEIKQERGEKTDNTKKVRDGWFLRQDPEYKQKYWARDGPWPIAQ